MMHPFKRLFAGATIAFLASAACMAHAQEAAIRKNLLERLPQLGAVDEVVKSPIAGLWEVRVGTDLFYTDSQGGYLVQGTIVETRTQRNLTEERQRKLLTVAFDSLPLKDAFVIVRGNGKRKIAIFEDPNCSYCRRFEQDLQKVDNVTIYIFLYPILGQDSVEKSRNLWCAKDRARAWLDWMLKAQAAPAAQCDTAALDRILAFGRKYKINGTPTTVIADGSRTPGAMPADQLEKLMAGSRD